MGDAAERWRAGLEAWVLPRALLDAAPEDPYILPVGLLTTPLVEPLQTPTGRIARQRLGGLGVLLDVGCGAGRFTAAFRGVARKVVGVEPKPQYLSEARRAGIEVIQGTWPAIARRCPSADVVLSTHVLYDVPDAGPFIGAMHELARREVVLELTTVHPWAPLAPLYRQFHGLDRPSGPTVEDAARVVEEVTGSAPEVERWERRGNQYTDLAALVAHRRRQLCLTSERDPEIAAALEGTYERQRDGTIATPPVEVATLSWSP